MLLQRSKLAATSLPRPRLAPPWLVALVAAMMVLVMVIVFPRDRLLNLVLAGSEEDQLTSAYVRNLMRTEPDNVELHLMAARQYLRARRPAEAEQALQPVLRSGDAEARDEGAALIWQIRLARWQALPDDSPRKPSQRDLLRQELRAQVAGVQGSSVLLDFAQSALQLGDADAALAIYRRIGQRRSDLGSDTYERLAREMLGRGEYAAAAELYFIARRQAGVLAEQRRCFTAGVRALQAGNRIGDALAAAERELGPLGNDSEALILVVEIARAANRIDIADHYVRRLLRLALLPQWNPLAVAPSAWHPVAATSEAGSGLPASLLPFDDRIYTLGYEVFVGNRKLDDALRLAQSAVRQAPDNAAWRARLAQVAEWNTQPRIALENYTWLARHGRSEAWTAVLRLAPGLFDYAALAPALQYQLRQTPGDRKVIQSIVFTYEQLGEPEAALSFLERIAAERDDPYLHEQLADLADRAGDPHKAAQHWQHLFARHVPTPAQAVRAAGVLLRLGRSEQAADLLARAEAGVTPDDAEYLRLTANVAAASGRDSQVLRAYRRLIEGGKASADDYAALVGLLRESAPQEAARLAEQAWQQFGRPADLLTAASLYLAQGQGRAADRLFQRLDAPTLTRLRRQADFLALRAQWHQQRGDAAAARRDIEAALALEPESSELAVSLLWALIDGGDPDALRRVLVAREATWRADPAMHPALASAYQYLSLPQVALTRYLTPQLAAHRDDFLWLMNYADALEQNQQTDAAWRLRQQLWRQRGAVSDRHWLDEAGLETAQRMARARLAMQRRGGDGELAVLRELLRLDRDAAGQLSPAARDVATAWLQAQAEYSAERGWLWQQYARNAARPLWAEITVALQNDDRETIGTLLDQYGSRLPRYDLINAARVVDDVRLAQSTAFESQEQQSDDDPLHLQLSDALLAHADGPELALDQRQLAALDERERRVGYHLGATPRLQLDLRLGSIERRSQDAQVITAVPARERYAGMTATWRHADGETRLIAESRRSLATYSPLRIEHDQRIDAKLTLRAGIGVHQVATESFGLRVAGMKDRIDLGVSYRPAQREQFNFTLASERYFGQTGTALGRGSLWQAEVVYPLRLETRDLTLSAFYEKHRFTREDNLTDAALAALIPVTASGLGTGFYVPENFTLYGLRVATNLRYRDDYSRAWRPYSALALTRNSLLGSGYDLSLGVAGNVMGADHLAITYDLAKGGGATAGQTRQLSARYWLRY